MLKLSRQRLVAGHYRDTRHVVERRGEREITILEIRQVIDGGFHEKSKDEYKVEHAAWNYSICGKTIDRRSLRVAISFDEDDWLLFITAFDLGRP